MAYLHFLFSYSSNKKFYIKCPLNKHESTLQRLRDLELRTFRKERFSICHFCASFAQGGIDDVGANFLSDYWDYD